MNISTVFFFSQWKDICALQNISSFIAPSNLLKTRLVLSTQDAASRSSWQTCVICVLKTVEGTDVPQTLGGVKIFGVFEGV